MPRFDIGRGKGAPPRAREADIVPMCFKCGWRNCRRVHPRRCLGRAGRAGRGMTSHATRYHDEFEAYIRERRPRPPTEPEGEEIEAMMTALGLTARRPRRGRCPRRCPRPASPPPSRSASTSTRPASRTGRRNRRRPAGLHPDAAIDAGGHGRRSRRRGLAGRSTSRRRRTGRSRRRRPRRAAAAAVPADGGRAMTIIWAFVPQPKTSLPLAR